MYENYNNSMQGEENKPTKILLVDDEPDVKGMVELKFRKQIKTGQYDFVFAQNGVEALDKLKINPDIDIVISDINMPEMDGLTLLDHIGNLNRTLKAIIVSAYGDMENIRTAMNRGAYDFLTKPIDFTDFRITIEKTKKTVEDIKGNIESLKKAETSLKESLARNYAILTSAADAIITFDNEGCIDTANPAAERLFGYKTKEFRNIKIHDIIRSAEENRSESWIYEYIEKLSENNESKSKDALGINLMGDTFPIGFSISEFSLKERKAFTIIIRDISIRKKAEKLLKEYNQTLEEEVSKRTKELIKLNNEKNEILGVAAHDLKNPLSNIKMLARVLLEENLSKEDIKEFAGDILSTSESMFELIRNLLDVNAIEQGKIKMNVADFDAEPIVKHIISGYNRSAQKKGILIEFNHDDSGKFIRADKNALMQVMDNLISNAVKYTPFNKKVYVSFSELGRYIVVEVRDEGPGISVEDQKKLFGKFARLSARPTGGESSTGLGLSIVKKLMEIMEGRVWCESVEGEGSTFKAAFPKSQKLINTQ